MKIFILLTGLSLFVLLNFSGCNSTAKNVAQSSDKQSNFLASKNKPTAKVTFSYAGGTEKQVDIIVFSENERMKLASLAPGQNSDISIPYGTYRLEYHYWQSEPNVNKGIKQIGTIKKDINTNNPINLILNSQYNNQFIQVPHYSITKIKNQTENEEELNYGILTIENKQSFPIVIFTEKNQRIETLVISEQETENLSTIPASGKITYKLPTKNIQLIAKDMTGKIIEEKTANLITKQTLIWKIQ